MKKSFLHYPRCLSLKNITLANIVLGSLLNLAQAEIITDGSVGAATNINGPNYTISEQLGRLAGDNLFHSFQSFNINSGEAANFTGSAAIKNVFSRVTGGDISTINGQLNSEIGSQGFYFINPAGVIFGSEARVNVPASFHVSTAEHILFSDASKYSAIDPSASSITVASPEAFGFGANTLAKISFDNPKIQLNNNSTLSVVAGEIEISQSDSFNKANTPPAGLTVQEGEIRLISHGQEAGIVSIAGTPDTDHTGNINITGSRLSVAGNGSGSVIIRGGDAELINAKFIMDNNGDVDAQNGLDLKVQNLLMESKNLVDADAMAGGDGAQISISAANNMQMIDSSIDLVSQGNGHGGDITISANNLTFSHGTKVITSTKATGNAGNIVINAENILLDGGISQIDQQAGVLIASQSLSEAKGGEELTITQAAGHGGNININADSIDIIKTAVISTSTFAKGDGGKITITANRLNIDSEGFLGVQSPLSTGIFSNAEVYKTTVQVRNPDVTIVIPGTDIEIHPLEPIDVEVPSSGQAGEISLQINGDLSLSNGGEITSSTFSQGDAGKVDIDAKNLVVDQVFNFSWKITEAGEYIPLNQWDSTEGEFITQSKGGLFSSSVENALGDAGTINLNTETLIVSNGGTIESSSSTTGEAGSIAINTTGLITLENTGLISIKGHDKSTSSDTAEVPTLNITAGEIAVQGGSNISSQSDGNAPASNINIHTENGLTVQTIDAQSINDFSKISSEADNADSGSITITGSSLLLEKGLVTTSTGFLVDGNPVIIGDGGDISIDSDALIMSNGFIQANTQGVSGHGGAIFIGSDQVITAFNSLEVGGGEARDFVPNSGINVIQAAAPEGTPGDIEIVSPIDDVTSTIHAVDSSFKPLILVADNPCQLDSGESPSSLIFTGKGATPQAATDSIMLVPGSLSNFEGKSKGRDKGKLATKNLVHNKPAFLQKTLAKSVCSR